VVGEHQQRMGNLTEEPLADTSYESEANMPLRAVVNATLKSNGTDQIARGIPRSGMMATRRAIAGGAAEVLVFGRLLLGWTDCMLAA
jgi:hypothetical protein